jgi:hypothetical protein
LTFTRTNRIESRRPSCILSLYYRRWTNQCRNWWLDYNSNNYSRFCHLFNNNLIDNNIYIAQHEASRFFRFFEFALVTSTAMNWRWCSRCPWLIQSGLCLANNTGSCSWSNRGSRTMTKPAAGLYKIATGFHFDLNHY